MIGSELKRANSDLHFTPFAIRKLRRTSQCDLVDFPLPKSRGCDRTQQECTMDRIDSPPRALPQSTARIAGHPIHPMLLPFPISFLVGALLTDSAYLHWGSP